MTPNPAVSLPPLRVRFHDPKAGRFAIESSVLDEMTEPQALEALHRIETWPQVVEALESELRFLSDLRVWGNLDEVWRKAADTRAQEFSAIVRAARGKA